MRGCLVACTLMGAFVFAACGGGGSPAPTAAPRTATATASRTATPNAPPPSPTASSSTPPSSGESGIEGTVTIGPTCPVQRIDSPCPDRPYEATVSVLDAAGSGVLTSVRSGSDGRFRVLLPAGRYLVRSESETAFSPREFEEIVEVENGRFTQVQIVFDSGIR